jgi:CHASE2 domain-containing sensor protein
MKNLIKHRGLLASFIAVLAVIAVLGLMALFIAWLCSLPVCPGKGLFGNIVVSIMITLIAFLLIWLLTMFIQAVYDAVNSFVYTLVSPKYYEFKHPFYPINPKKQE